MKNKAVNLQKDAKNILVDDLKILESYIEDFWHFLPIPVCYTSSLLNILYVGKSFEEYFGFPPAEIIGENLKKSLKTQKI